MAFFDEADARLTTPRQIAREQFGIRGERGGYPRIVSKEDGSMTKELKLDGVPVSDGMSVADGKSSMCYLSEQIWESGIRVTSISSLFTE